LRTIATHSADFQDRITVKMTGQEILIARLYPAPGGCFRDKIIALRAGDDNQGMPMRFRIAW
jgi:hypothetical protein